ncbi:MAG: hypothetical protein WBD87_05140 [Candidatus Acidiferrales bacterium]
MKRFWISCIAVAALGWPAWGQKVEVEKPDRGKIIHVQTALNHLTVLEMSEPVSTVAVGSSAFRVEWRGNKVFIEPIEPDVSTNLFVWTPAGRFNYELDPAGVVPEMVFAIDQPTPDPPKVTASANRGSESADPSPAEILILAKPVRLHGSIPDKNRVAIYLTDSLERDGQVFIRYTIRNETKKAYVPGSPQAWALNGPRYSESLYVLANSQLSSDETTRLKCKGEAPLEVVKSEMRSSQIEPGQETTGIVAIKLPVAQAGPTVLQLTFLAGPKGPINATLVL